LSHVMLTWLQFGDLHGSEPDGWESLEPIWYSSERNLLGSRLGPNDNGRKW
jgi:hypothetical protein